MKAILITFYLLIVAPVLYGQIVVPRLANDVEKPQLPDNIQAIISFIESRPDTLKLSGEVTPELLTFVRNTKIPIGCLDLREAKLDNNEIADYAFGGNVGLTRKRSFEAFPIRSILLPQGLKRIGVNAFFDCPLQGEIRLPDSVEEIGLGAFRNCKNITSINLPKSCHTIGNNSFVGLLKLSGKVTIPSTLTLVIPQPFFDLIVVSWENPFARCPLLTDFEVEKGNTAFTTDGKSLYLKDVNEIILLSVIPSVNGIYTVSNQISYIATSAFYGSQLTQINFQRNSLKLGYGCFAQCKNLELLRIPKNVDTNGYFPFENNSDRIPRTLIFESKTPIKLIDYETYYQDDFTIVVPKGSKKKYEKDKGWSDGWTIKEN